MTSLDDELKENFSSFAKSWRADANKNLKNSTNDKKFLESYKRICSLNGWYSYVLKKNSSPDACGFFLECQNDALVAHINANLGAWRSSLMSLRSCLENGLRFLYYKDHPIELELWKKGQHRIGVSELLKYFDKHPFDANGMIKKAATDLQLEYKKLSTSVHSAAVDFRMISGQKLQLLSTTSPKISIWSTHERKLLSSLNILFICLYPDEISGTKLSGLREIIGYTLTKQIKQKIKTNYKVHIS